MGKRRILKKQGSGVDSGKRDRALSKLSKRQIDRAVLYIESTYNNTKVTLSDTGGGAIMWSSSGSLGFTGNRKSTPFAAAKVGELIGDKAIQAGVTEAAVVIRGIGAGREAAVRAFSGKGVAITRIADETPVPHNGVRPPRARRI